MVSQASAMNTSTTPKIELNLCEADIIKMVLEFFESRQLNIAQIALERETGIINGVFSNDALFLRQLVIDGSWDTALDFVEPLKNLPAFDFKRFKYFILKYKFFELLCIKNEPGCLNNNEFTVEELVECLQNLEPLCPSQDDYHRLCALLTLPKLADDDSLAGWNPSGARVECFGHVFPLVQKFLVEHNSTHQAQLLSCQCSSKDRLLQLLVRGLMYENCMALCQNRAVRSKTCDLPRRSTALLVDPPQPLDSEVEGSLYSWLKAVSADSFTLPFGRELLDLQLERLKRPCIEAAWAEQILATPLKPNVFPHNVTPVSRLKSAQKMSLSMVPQYEMFSVREKLASIHENPPSFVSSLVSSDRRSRFLSQSVVVSNVGFQLSGCRRVNRAQQDAIDALLERSLVAARPTVPSESTSNTAGSDDDATVISGGSGDELPLPSTPRCASGGGPPTAIVAPSSHRRLKLKRRDDGLAYKERRDNVEEDEEGVENRTDEEIDEHRNVEVNAKPADVAKGQESPIALPRKPLTARQQLDDLTRRAPGKNEAPEMHKTNNGCNFTPSTLMNSTAIASSGKLYEQFNKNRCMGQDVVSDLTPILRPKCPDDDTAYQMMQMSLYSANSSNRTMSRVQQAMLDQRPSGQFGGSVKKLQTQQQTNGRPSVENTASASHVSGNGTIQRGVPAKIEEDQRDCDSKPVKFRPICRLEDQQAIRTSAFHPSGKFFAVGTNSRQLHVCLYPEVKTVRADEACRPVDIQFTRSKQHKGSIYSVAFNPTGELLATGSNDKTIRLMQFDSEKCKIGAEFELTHHDGTVRDIIFMEDTSNSTSLLISGGAGNCRINVVDCATGSRLSALQGHTAPILGLHTWGGCMFVSCSQDKTTKFWDLRCQEAVSTVFPDNKTSNSPVTSVCVDVTGRLLVSGHEDASIMLYDMQGCRALQCYHAHSDQVRTVRFSPGNYYLLSGSYDKKIVVTDMRGDLVGNLQYLPVAEHDDKIVQCRWHPHDFTFLSTSADRTTVLWALPTARYPHE